MSWVTIVVSSTCADVAHDNDISLTRITAMICNKIFKYCTLGLEMTPFINLLVANQAITPFLTGHAFAT